MTTRPPLKTTGSIWLAPTPRNSSGTTSSTCPRTPWPKWWYGICASIWLGTRITSCTAPWPQSASTAKACTKSSKKTSEKSTRSKSRVLLPPNHSRRTRAATSERLSEMDHLESGVPVVMGRRGTLQGSELIRNSSGGGRGQLGAGKGRISRFKVGRQGSRIVINSCNQSKTRLWQISHWP